MKFVYLERQIFILHLLINFKKEIICLKHTSPQNNSLTALTTTPEQSATSSKITAQGHCNIKE